MTVRLNLNYTIKHETVDKKLNPFYTDTMEFGVLLLACEVWHNILPRKITISFVQWSAVKYAYFAKIFLR
jgi:hypothetical protein